MTKYVSSVLRCNVEDHECPVCEFLNGDTRKESLLAVIRILDLALAESEDHVRVLTKSLVDKVEP